MTSMRRVVGRRARGENPPYIEVANPFAQELLDYVRADHARVQAARPAP